jgi:hypothetical protein
MKHGILELENVLDSYSLPKEFVWYELGYGRVFEVESDTGMYIAYLKYAPSTNPAYFYGISLNAQNYIKEEIDLAILKFKEHLKTVLL